MLAHDAVRHEKAKSGTAFLCSEVGLEEVVAMLIRDTWTVVGDAEVRSAIAPAGASGDAAP
jgi:hypothetical protein